jgi:hypothetical protein
METHGAPNHSRRRELIMEGRMVRSLKDLYSEDEQEEREVREGLVKLKAMLKKEKELIQADAQKLAIVGDAV